MSRTAARSKPSFTCRVTKLRFCSGRRAVPPSWRRRRRACRFSNMHQGIKQATVGTGGARKNQVAFMMRALLGLTETPDADSADALAIALTHLRAQEAARLGIPGATQI